MLAKCGLSCFFYDVNKEQSNKIDKDLAKEKLYYKRQVKYLTKYHILRT